MARKKTVTKKSAAKKPKRTKLVCISHKEDADGIGSASLIRQAFGGESVLVDYPGQMDAIQQVASDPKLKKLFICDLGLSKKTQDAFVDIMRSLKKQRVSVTYIDHHDMDGAIERKLKALKVTVIHDIRECTTVQVYEKFKSKLGENASFIAACAAITDYMEDRAKASALLQVYDRQFALVNATILTYNIVGHQKDPEYLLYLVETLSEGKYPHDIPNSFELAQLQVQKLAQTMQQVRSNMKVLKNLGYMEIMDAGASGAVNFVLGFSGRNVGVAYKERVDKGIYAVSVRGSKSCRTHLGKLVNALAADLGGSGGGHDRACGAVIPKPKIMSFVKSLNKKLG